MMAAAIVLWLGCEAAKYRRAADEEVFDILKQRQEEVLGTAAPMEAKFATRKPTDVNGTSIILNRFSGQTNRVLTLPDALELAVQGNRTYQFNREKLYLSALSLTGTRHRFALKFTKAETDLGVTRGTDKGLDGSSDASVTLSQLMKTGGTLTASLANDLVLYFDGKPKVPSLTLNLTQPLLRGAGADIATEVLTQAERDVVYEVRDFSHYQKTFALEVVNDYLDLLQQGDSMRLSYNNYTNRLFFQTEVNARVNGGLQAEFNAKQAQQSVYTAKISYISATNAFQNALDDFKQKLSLPLGTDLRLDFNVLEQLDELGLPPVAVSDEVGYYLAITNRLDFLNVIDRFEDSKRKVKVARQDLLPSLSLIADASLKDEFYSSFQPEDFTATAKVRLNLPLDQLAERNAYRTSLINFERQIRTLATQLDKLRDGIRADVRNLERQRQNYFTQLDALKNAEEELLATRERLRLGFAGVRTRDIITAQDGLLAAQQALSRAMVDYHKTRLKLLKDVGSLDTTQETFWLKTDPTSAVQLEGNTPGASEDVVPPTIILGE